MTLNYEKTRAPTRNTRGDRDNMHVKLYVSNSLRHKLNVVVCMESFIMRMKDYIRVMMCHHITDAQSYVLIFCSS